MTGEGERHSGRHVTGEGERARDRGKYGGAGCHFAQRAVRVFLATSVKELSVAPVDETHCGVSARLARKQRDGVVVVTFK